MKKTAVLGLTMMGVLALTSCGIGNAIKTKEFRELIEKITDVPAYKSVSTSGTLNVLKDNNVVNVPLNFTFNVEDGKAVANEGDDDFKKMAISILNEKHVNTMFKVTETGTNTYYLLEETSYSIEGKLENKKEDGETTINKYLYSFDTYGYPIEFDEIQTIADNQTSYNSKLELSISWSL